MSARRHTLIPMGDPTIERFPCDSMRDVNLACTIWLRDRGLLYDSPAAERFSELSQTALRRRWDRQKLKLRAA